MLQWTWESRCLFYILISSPWIYTKGQDSHLYVSSDVKVFQELFQLLLAHLSGTVGKECLPTFSPALLLQEWFELLPWFTKSLFLEVYFLLNVEVLANMFQVWEFYHYILSINSSQRDLKDLSWSCQLAVLKCGDLTWWKHIHITPRFKWDNHIGFYHLII